MNTDITGIPAWFREENSDHNIWKPPFDYERVEKEICELEAGLLSEWGEREIQNFLKVKPYLFDGMYRHGHGTYVFYEIKFGSQYIADWVIGNGHSGGLLWDLIELECPKSIPFIQNGHFSDATRKGINQIQDWRNWIQQNIDMVQKSKSQDGLGLVGLNNHAKGTVVSGRREMYQSKPAIQKYNRNRVLCNSQNHIEIISYETLIEGMRFHINRLTSE